MAVMGSEYREVDIRHYPMLVYGLVPLAALVLQAWLPRVLWNHAWFDLPLIVTVYFALGRRIPIQGTLMGAALGLFEDALTHHPIGVNGIAKTIAGFIGSSIGLRIDTENHTIRLTVIFLLSLLTSGIYFVIFRLLLGMDDEWNWIVELVKSVVNSVLAMIFYPLLDRTQIRD